MSDPHFILMSEVEAQVKADPKRYEELHWTAEGAFRRGFCHGIASAYDLLEKQFPAAARWLAKGCDESLVMRYDRDQPYHDYSCDWLKRTLKSLRRTKP